MRNPLSKTKKKKYAGSIVLGLNDAIVEITGALTGLTYALQKTSLIAATGLIVGVAASLSMAASEYLHEKENKKPRPLKYAIYTGVAYLITVILLVSPYLFLNNVYISAAAMLAIAIIIIAVYSYYISNQSKFSFKKRFLNMVLISLGVAAISFVIGKIIRSSFGIEV
jgi:vacuolar iron transporter family protein